MTLVKEMLCKVETEQRTKLEQLEQMKQEQKSIEITKITPTPDPKTLVSLGDNKPKSMMSQFLNGFGISGMMSASSPKEPESSPKPEHPTVTPSAPTPQKVSLSLEEKQRLAKSQEDHRKFKSQQPLNPKQTDTKSLQNNQPRDLTSSLIDSNIKNMNKTSLSSSTMSSAGAYMGGNSGGYMGSNSSTTSYMGSNSNTTSYMGSNSSTPAYMGGNSAFGAGNSVNGSRANASKSVDLSAFDNLLPNKPKKSLNEMKNSQSAQSFGQNQSMGNMGMPRMMGSPAQQGMMGNQGMMGYQQSMATGAFGQPQQFGQMGGNQMMYGQQNMMTSQQNMMTSQQNMMTSQQNMMTSSAAMGSNFMMPQTMSTNQKVNNSNTTDLSDIFG
ncbi:SCY1-like protein 2 [Patella vulgata]|uniref:SCY1-like protein 2 n=1 Tax=Patella vulgata TaxID=6465 RepID=UPI0024A81EE9|nr:SCY1-like protein 2 [Patella vulgata]